MPKKTSNAVKTKVIKAVFGLFEVTVIQVCTVSLDIFCFRKSMGGCLRPLVLMSINCSQTSVRLHF